MENFLNNIQNLKAEYMEILEKNGYKPKGAYVDDEELPTINIYAYTKDGKTFKCGDGYMVNIDDPNEVIEF